MACALSPLAMSAPQVETPTDAEVETLIDSLVQSAGPEIRGFLQVRFDQSADRPIAYTKDLNGDGDTTDPGESGVNDLGGFFIRRARVAFEGHVQGYGYHVEMDAVLGDLLREAYIDIPLNTLKARVGLYKSGVSRNSLTRANELFFIERSMIGEMFEQRDLGATLYGGGEQIGLSFTMQNGRDELGDDYFFAGRAVWNFLGKGANRTEGAYSGPESLAGTASVAYFHDQLVPDGNGLIGEVHMGTNVYSFGAETIDLGDGGAQATPELGLIAGTRTMTDPGGTPFGVYGTYMVSPDRWEVGARYQYLDDTDNSSTLEFGVNRYLAGHELKYSANYANYRSDNVGFEGNLIQVSLQVTF